LEHPNRKPSANSRGCRHRDQIRRKAMEELKDKWFNIEAVAEYLSITEDTARTWVREGKLPAYRVGKRYKFKLSEIDEWVRSGRINEGDESDE
jgi:excisionase family DNA binding protein